MCDKYNIWFYNEWLLVRSNLVWPLNNTWPNIFFALPNVSYEQGETPNVHKPLPSDMCHAIRQAVEMMERCSSDSESKNMIVCDHDKGVLQDRLDDMWIMYCIAHYTNNGAIAREGMQCTVDSNEG